jgi:pimeloyl-ACP methyl ester carboxylesterase
VAEQLFISYQDSRINYLRFGTGNQRVICFHGYGETAESFSFLEKFAGDRFRFYAIDLPFHGMTEWREGLEFGVRDLEEIVQLILREEDGLNIEQANQEQGTSKLGTLEIHTPIIVMGYSLGGRVALRLYQSQPSLIKKIILLAPDGLKVNFWYWLATATRIGNRFFLFTMKHPSWFFGFLKLLNKLGLVNASIFKFVNYYIGDAAVRNALYERWTGLRKLKPDLKKIRRSIRQHKTFTGLLYGKHDRIILSVVGERFRKGIEEHCKLKVIEAGHQVLHEKYKDEIIGLMS